MAPELIHKAEDFFSHAETTLFLVSGGCTSYSEGAASGTVQSLLVHRHPVIGLVHQRPELRRIVVLWNQLAACRIGGFLVWSSFSKAWATIVVSS